MELVGEGIYYTPQGCQREGEWMKPGYYFVDETSDYVGPYDSAEECEVMQEKYKASI